MSEHFSLAELTRSSKAELLDINNFPVEAYIVDNLEKLANHLEVVREIVGVPIKINSGYRCPSLNKAIGGSAKSDHMLGLAADINASGFTPKQFAKVIVENKDKIGFRQCILEFDTWVHLSFPDDGVKPKLEVLTAVRGTTGTIYSQGIA